MFSNPESGNIGRNEQLSDALDDKELELALQFCEDKGICEKTNDEITDLENSNGFFNPESNDDKDIIGAKEIKEIFSLLQNMIENPYFKTKIAKKIPELGKLSNEEINILLKTCEIIFANNELVSNIGKSVVDGAGGGAILSLLDKEKPGLFDISGLAGKSGGLGVASSLYGIFNSIIGHKKEKNIIDKKYNIS